MNGDIQQLSMLDAIAAIAEKAMPLNGNGTNRYNNSNTYESETPSIQGNDPEYLTARIARDRPDILERISAPETPAKRTQPQHDGIACPLCKGHLTGSTCDKCGMEVER